MADKWIIITLLLLTVIQVKSQFFDIFQSAVPYTYQTIRPINIYYQDITTKRPRNNYQRNDARNTNSQERGSESWKERGDKTRGKITIQSYHTPKPVSRANYNSSQNYNNPSGDYSNTRANYNNDKVDYNKRQDNYNIVDDRPDYTTTRTYPDYGATRNYYTTYNPLYNIPGVKPFINNNRPPITNRPATQKPYAVFPVPSDSSAIRFPAEPDDSPPVLTGPDEETMSNVEKRRYFEVAEKMCDKYKALSVKKVEAIPLLPSPEPIQINITDCEPVSVPLVVGGKVASIREFPHMALLGWTKVENGGYSWKCGGSLVSDKFVLTAAHCSYQDRDNTVVTGAPRVVQLGSSYLDDPGSLVIKVASVYRHPKYTQSRSYYDIALLKLLTPVKFSVVVKPACLGVPPPVGEKVVATGWGRTEFGGDQSLELRSVLVPIWDMKECKRVLGTSRKLPDGPSSESQVCAGETGKDTCQGDSGGPAQVSEGCIWRVVAVTSVGRSCGAANTPALYATIHKAFIAAVIYGDQVKNEQKNNRNNNKPQNNYNNDRNNNRDTNNYESNSNNNYNRPNNNQNNMNNYNNDRNSNRDTNNYDSGTNNNYNRPNNNQNNYNNNRNGNSDTNNYDSNTNNNYNRPNNNQNNMNNDRNSNRDTNNNYDSNTNNNYNRPNNNQNNKNNYNNDRNNNRDTNSYEGNYSNNNNDFNRPSITEGTSYNNNNYYRPDYSPNNNDRSDSNVYNSNSPNYNAGTLNRPNNNDNIYIPDRVSDSNYNTNYDRGDSQYNRPSILYSSETNKPRYDYVTVTNRPNRPTNTNYNANNDNNNYDRGYSNGNYRGNGENYRINDSPRIEDIIYWPES